jgi:hypothetical protein
MNAISFEVSGYFSVLSGGSSPQKTPLKIPVVLATTNFGGS